ncbi:MAG: alpha/beta hydrolase [Deltaproteobacteria bacterium]|nr:MAG: alpha/beta hydrolase [Deltaproteobacteria bacterium]
MRLTRLGEGRPAVLIPGNELPAAFYASFGKQLEARGIGLHALTLPGYEGTPPLAEPSWAGMVEAATPVVRDTLGDDGVLIGHSLGGLLGLVLAAEISPKRLALMEPAIIPWGFLASISAWIYQRSAVDDDHSEVKLQGPGFLRVANAEAYPQAMIEAVRHSRMSTDLGTARGLVQSSPALYPLPYAAVRCPTLLVRGEASGPYIAAGIWRLNRLLPDATRVDIPDAGHWLMNEADAPIAEAIAAWASPSATA